MPSNVIDTKRDERLWEKATELAKERGKGKDYAYIMGIYKRMEPDHEFESDKSAAARVAKRWMEARQTEDYIRMEALFKAVEGPLRDASAVLHPWKDFKGDGEAIRRRLSQAAQAVVDNLEFHFERDSQAEVFKKNLGRKLGNIRKLYLAWARAKNWDELVKVLKSQATRQKEPWHKHLEARDLVLGAIRFFDREQEGSFEVGGYQIALITHPSAEWGNEAIGKLRHILTEAASILTRKGFGMLAKGKVVATPGENVKGNTLASYNTRSHVMMLAVGGQPDRIIKTLIHELGHAYYFEHMGGQGRAAWEQFFGDNVGSPDVDRIIQAWERFVANPPDWEAGKYGRYSPYFYQYLKRTNPDMAMWLSMLIDQLQIKEPQHAIHGFKRNTVPGLDQLKAKKNEAKVFLHPVTAYSASSAEELYAETFAHFLVDGPRRVPPIVLDVFKRATPQARTAARQASGFDGFDLFDDVPESEPSPELKARIKVEKILGGLGSMMDARTVLRDSRALKLVDGKFYYWQRQGAWFVYIDVPKAQMRSAVQTVQKGLIPRTKVHVSVPVLHDKVLYVGTNEGEVTKFNPVQKRAAGNEYHHVVAHAWSKLSWYPAAHMKGLDAIWNEMFDTLPPEDLDLADWDQTWGKGIRDKLLNASKDLDSGKMLPPKKGVRLLHSLLKGDANAVIDKILRSGMKADAKGVGKYSEDPNAIFFVEGTGNKRHSDRGAWIVVDLPENWEGWEGALGASWSWKEEKLRDKPSPQAVVAIYRPIPAKFVVAVNGLPTADYKRSRRKKSPPVVKQARPIDDKRKLRSERIWAMKPKPGQFARLREWQPWVWGEIMSVKPPSESDPGRLEIYRGTDQDRTYRVYPWEVLEVAAKPHPSARTIYAPPRGLDKVKNWLRRLAGEEESVFARRVLGVVLAQLRAMQQNYWASHWMATGTSAYGDHLLFERLYEAMGDEIDTLAEKMVGLFGNEAVQGSTPIGTHTINDALAFYLNEWEKTGDLYHRALHTEQALQENLRTSYEALKALGSLTLGLDDFLMNMASTHDTAVYLLSQRLRRAAAMPRWRVSLFSDQPGAKPLWTSEFRAPDGAEADQKALHLVRPQLNRYPNAEDWVVEQIGGKRGSKTARSNLKVVEVPNTFHAVKLEPPKAKRAEFPFQGYIDFQGIQIDVENKAGSIRSGHDPQTGDSWETYMHYHYGEIRGTEGADGDKLDVYVGPNHDSSIVVVIHQVTPQTGQYDEDKVMLGFDSIEEAIGAYKKQYDRPGFYREGEHTAMPIGAFWRWVHDTRNKGKRVRLAAQRLAVQWLQRQVS